MKKAIGYAAISIFLFFIAGVFAVVLSSIATFTAPLHNPAFAEEILCPPGSQLKSEWYRATHNKPGQRTLSATCLDSQGRRVAANPLDETALMKGIRFYFSYCFAIVFALGAIFFLTMAGLAKAIKALAFKMIRQ